MSRVNPHLERIESKNRATPKPQKAVASRQPPRNNSNHQEPKPKNLLFSKRPRLYEIDPVLLWLTIVLMTFGLIMVYSASIALPNANKYFNKQLFGIVLGLSLGYVGSLIPSSTWEKYTPHLFVIAVVLLTLVLIPGIGLRVNGARRWINLIVLNFQPSELMKFAVCLYAASYCVRKKGNIVHFSEGVLPMVVAVTVVGGLLMLEPDLGALGVIIGIVMGILFLAGVELRIFLTLILVIATLMGLMIWLTPWRFERMISYLNPWDIENAQNKAYQLTQSLIAFGHGGVFGQGLETPYKKCNTYPKPIPILSWRSLAKSLALLRLTVGCIFRCSYSQNF